MRDLVLDVLPWFCINLEDDPSQEKEKQELSRQGFESCRMRSAGQSTTDCAGRGGEEGASRWRRSHARVSAFRVQPRAAGWPRRDQGAARLHVTGARRAAAAAGSAR